MTAITAIVLIVGLYAPQQQLPSSSPPKRSAESVTTHARADDSTKSVNKTKMEVGTPRQSDVTKDAALDVYPVSEKLKETARKARNDGDAPTSATRRLELFAAWTKERIRGCEVYDLDSLELSRIGIIVSDDSTISRSYGNFTIGMKEDMSDGSVLIRIPIGKPRSVTDSIKLARAIEKSTLHSGPGISEPIRPAERVPVHEVLITNSRGRTFSHAVSTGNQDTVAAIGSGDYSGDELVAIRVRFQQTTLTPGAEDYYYLYWYEPTKTFLDLMPPRVRQAIERRKGMDSRIAHDESAVAKSLKTSSVYPNPVTSDIATLDYTLREKRRVAISVYDITGERIRNVAVSEQREPGAWQENISLSGIPDGYYLLAVTTDNGEQNIHPMVLKR
ncbi:MAG: T9SS type A sorting domain-containing protein [Bacteroidia bacterium]|nr:T9SS type A sorting domain-containing protein [Bacteroidia bacterium]